MSNSINVDEEWEHFISKNNNYDYDSDEDDYASFHNVIPENIANEQFVSPNLSEKLMLLEKDENNHDIIPEASNIYISTKTKIAYLNQPIDLKFMFWIIPVLQYMETKEGVIKKQMKFNSISEEELADIKNKLQNENYYDEQIITSIINPNGRIKFKDIRKITIGLSKKDIMSYRSKKKSAFYNCFVLILRMKVDNIFKEFHVKVFNTGKLEIPGIQSDDIFERILDLVVKILQPNLKEKLSYKENTCETVLINSNFNCGFYINREILYEILKYNYNIQAIYDPCSYPGIQCKFYFNPDGNIENGCGFPITMEEEKNEINPNMKQVSFMIFRTGSILIVGKCDENVLFHIYEFLKNILKKEYMKIRQKNGNLDWLDSNQNKIEKDKKKKIRRKNILITIME